MRCTKCGIQAPAVIELQANASKNPNFVLICPDCADENDKLMAIIQGGVLMLPCGKCSKCLNFAGKCEGKLS